METHCDSEGQGGDISATSIHVFVTVYQTTTNLQFVFTEIGLLDNVLDCHQENYENGKGRTIVYTITNWRVSLSKICHEWPNNAVTHECNSSISYRYSITNRRFWISK